MGTSLIHFRGQPSHVLSAQELVERRLAPFAVRQGLAESSVLRDPLTSMSFLKQARDAERETSVVSLTEGDFWLVFITEPMRLEALQINSGARISVPPGPNSAGYRDVTIEGTASQVRAAIALIEQILGHPSPVIFQSSHQQQQGQQQMSAQEQLSVTGLGSGSGGGSNSDPSPSPPSSMYFPAPGLQQQQQQPVLDVWDSSSSSMPSVNPWDTGLGFMSGASPQTWGEPIPTGAAAPVTSSTFSFPQNVAKTIRLPSSLVGFLIGRNGLTVRQIQDQTGTSVAVSRDTGADLREITISGDALGVSRCENLILEHITPHMTGSGNAISSVSVMVPDEKVGLVIGKRGAIIRQLQDQSHAKIFMPSGQPLETPEKEIRIVGSPDQIAFARLLIQRCLAPKEVEDLQIDRDLGEK